MRPHYNIRKPEEMVEYLVDCTLATVETMLGKKTTPKRGEFERQCSIAQKGVDFLLGAGYEFTGRYVKIRESGLPVYGYYRDLHEKILGGAP